MKRLFVVIVMFGLCLTVAPSVFASVGFFAPSGIPPESVINKVQIGLFNAVSSQQVARNLDRLSGTKFRAFIDLGHIITHSTDPSRLHMSYTTGNGVVRRKEFKPSKNNKLRSFPPDGDLRQMLGPVMAILAKHAANVSAVFLADEPYLNGISKSEMERAAKVVRDELDSHGLQRVKIGVIFASGMFNSGFAHLMNDQAGIYAAGIDDYYRENKADPNKAFTNWVHAIKTNRLVTYDRAGNMYLGGGLPRGFNIYGFDFYLSTILLDSLHEHSLSWFANHYPGHDCAQFSGKTMSQVRSRLSFFHPTSVHRDMHSLHSDKRILNAVYQCRMGSVTAMLKQSARGLHGKQFLLVSESSDNGVLDFGSKGDPEHHQPAKLIELRVLHEVERAEKFYAEHECFYTAGLLFFSYKNVYDYSIKLAVGGASSMPSVMHSIYRFAAGHSKQQVDATCSSRRAMARRPR